MPLPTLRRKQESTIIRGGDLFSSNKSLGIHNNDLEERRPKNTLQITESPLNDSLLMLVDLAQDIQVTKYTRYQIQFRTLILRKAQKFLQYFVSPKFTDKGGRG